MHSKIYKALQVFENASGKFQTEITEKKTDGLPAGDVLIRVYYSSLNYKDALSASGNRGVTRYYPHTPGVDAAGIVEMSNAAEWKVGDQVIVTGFDLGMNTSGGFSQYIRVPKDWIISLPEGMTLKESMVYGTAGLTAALSVSALIKNDLTPEKGKVVVTGATGGVGSFAVAILAKLGYSVNAVSSKVTAVDYLTTLGASEIIPRAEMEDKSGKALLKPRFAGGIDTVGGQVLATLLKSLDYEGVAACCGMVNGGELPTTVFPFILKGVQLVGIDSVLCPIGKRIAAWNLLASAWRPHNLESIAHVINLEQLPQAVETMLKGKMQGRAVVRID